MGGVYGRMGGKINPPVFCANQFLSLKLSVTVMPQLILVHVWSAVRLVASMCALEILVGSRVLVPSHSLFLLLHRSIEDLTSYVVRPLMYFRHQMYIARNS